MNLAAIHNELDQLFDRFNDHFFQNELEKPMIIIQSTGKKPINGYCTLVKTWVKQNDEEPEFYEIGISAEHLSREVYGICGTLLHEMVHLYNLKMGVKDVSPNFVKHNKRFKTEAEKRGLIISQAPRIGWSVTELNDDTKALVDSFNLDPDTFNYSRIVPVKVPKEKKKTYTYMCPVCEEKLRSKNGSLKIICEKCSSLEDEEITYFENQTEVDDSDE